MRRNDSWILFGALTFTACAGADDDPSSGGGGSVGATNSSSSGGAGGTGGAGGAQATVTSSSSSTTTTTSSSTTGAGGGAVCGDGVIEPGETCEGQDFGGKTCASFGLSSGTLVCNSFCNVVLTGCVPKETCNDGTDNDTDGLIDCDDSDCASVTSCTDSCASLSNSPLPLYDFSELAGRPDNLSASCGGSTGREQVFAVTAFGTEDLTVQLNPSGFDGSISVRTACQDPASEIACVDAGGSSATESLSVPVSQGETYFVIVEATSPGGVGFYGVSIDQPMPESQCGNWFDDDFDGYFDCDDPSECKGQSSECTPGGQTYGTSCFSHTQCNATSGDPFCQSFGQGFPSGYCSEFCDPTFDPCVGDGVCVQIGVSVHGVCFDGCTTAADCAPGLSCVDSGTGPKYCDKPAEVNCLDYADNDFDGFVDCEDATSCIGSPLCAPGAGPVGSPCQIHGECAAGDGDPLCISSFQLSWPGGYCSEWCELGAGDCPADAACVSYLNLSSSGNGQCLQLCTSGADCRPGYICNPVFPFDGTSVCVP